MFIFVFVVFFFFYYVHGLFLGTAEEREGGASTGRYMGKGDSALAF